MNDSLGDRMKRYEDVTRDYLTPRLPVVVRVDGRAFHTYTRGFLPFDELLRGVMVDAAKKVAEEMQGFEVAYHQSDEVSFLLTDYATHETSCWFEYNVQKVASISAAVMTAWFNRLMTIRLHEQWDQRDSAMADDPTVYKAYEAKLAKVAYFDARAFNVPKEDVSNYYLWRCKDWERNSTQMYCRQFFSSKQMHGQGRADQHEMLHKIGKNWATDVPPHFRNGSFIRRAAQEVAGTARNDSFEVLDNVVASYPAISAVIDPLVHKAVK